jgi:PTH2 family peptidyl-tRNA hydrolase
LTRPSDYKMVVVVRMDLGMSVGKMVAQACHAAVEASEESKRARTKDWRRWRDTGGRKVALEAESLEELRELARRAEELGIVNVLIEDAGHTEVPPGAVTCLGLGPDQAMRIDLVTGDLPLLK